MPRAPRWWVPDAGAHLISRFVDRSFHLGHPADRNNYFQSISKARYRWDWKWLSYAVMSSHVHHGLIAGDVPPERFYRSVNTRFALLFHERREGATIGPVFASRPKYYYVAPAALLRMVAYHHKNPVSAGVVERASQSRWTSHRAYLRLDPPPPWLDVEWALHTLGFSDTAQGRRHFDDFVAGFETHPVANPAPERALPSVARTGRQQTHDGARVLTAVCEVVGLSVEAMLRSNGKKSRLARTLVAHVATCELYATQAEIATWLGIHRGSVANLLRRHGPSRDPELAAMLTEARTRLTIRLS